jgi:hypothetical protein
MAEKPGLLRRMGSHLWERAKAIVPETFQTLSDKVVPQGASEIAHAIYNGQSNAYVPYGDAQRPVDVKGPNQSYQDMLRGMSQRGAPEQDREIGMDR